MKKAFSILMVAAMVLSGFAFANDGFNVQKSSSILEFINESGAPIDLGIANDEKLIEMLKKSGKIAEDATPAEAEEALRIFLKNKAKGASNEKGELAKKEKEREAYLKEKVLNNGVLNGKGNKKGNSNKVESVVEEAWDGSVTTDKILVILVDYSDYKHDQIEPWETNMYYPKYTEKHYDDMIFGENGYTGPNGEDFISMKQYYEQQSGGSYTVEGQIAGWYTSSKTAKENDQDTRSLVREALRLAAEDPTVDLSQFDQEDRYDLDGDGNFREPDGLVDHLMIIHAGVGEEAGGGQLGEDAIWSHRWNLGGVYAIPGTEAEVGYWGGSLAAYDYTIEPEDGATGVFAHEYGHDLGLPDEYDTQYTGAGEPVSYWSIMSSGSWAGLIGGTEPTGFSPWAKLNLQATLGGNWISGSVVNVNDLEEGNVEVLLDQANSKGTNNDVLMVTLPEKELIINTPYSGEYEYHSGSGNNLNNFMTTTIDLTNATNAKLSFKAWYQIEVDWDYASVIVNGESIPGNITTTTDPYHQNPGNGITGHSDGWVDAEFDLSQFVGEEITVGFNYWTDGYVAEPGFFADDIAITVDGTEVLFDDAEGDPLFDLNGFAKNTGKSYGSHYYLIEWRNHAGVDEGLGHIRRGNSVMKFDPGMVVWYADNNYDNNWTGAHPGEGYLGVVDADQFGNRWSDKAVGSTRYQVHDAAFSLQKTDKMYLDYMDLYGFYMRDNHTEANPLFDDSFDYSNKSLPDAGRNIPNYGLKIRVIGESSDRSVGKILLFK